MKKYPKGIRKEVVARIGAGESQCALSREYGISRYTIQCWLKEPVLPKTRGRKPAKTLTEYKAENKRLKMENELLRDFLRSTGSEAKVFTPITVTSTLKTGAV